MSADGQYRSLLDTGSVPFSGSRREMGYESRFHGLNQTSAVVFGTQERSLSRSGSGASSLASREFNTLTRRTNQTESTLMPLKVGLFLSRLFRMMQVFSHRLRASTFVADGCCWCSHSCICYL